MAELTNPHDRFFKETFSRLDVARNFFAHYLPPPVAQSLNLDTLALQSGSFIDADLQEQFADLLYQVTLEKEQPAYIYLLLEHKSYPDPQTPLQLLRYLVRIWERDSRAGHSLHPIVPVVVYHGRERWRVARNFDGLFAGPESLRPYWPAFRYELQDLSTFSDDEIRGAVHLQIGLLVLKYIFDPLLRDRLSDIFTLFADLAETKTALEYLGTVLYYIGKANTNLAPQEMVAAVQAALNEKGSEIMQTVADYWVKQGLEQGLEQGIEQGRVQTLRENILELLQMRFGILPNQVVNQINTFSNPDVLRQLLRQAFTAETLAGFRQSLPESE